MATATQTAAVMTWDSFQQTDAWGRLSAKRKVFLASYLSNGGDLAAAAHAAFDCKTERHAVIMGNEALRSREVVAALRLWRGQNKTDRELFIEELERAVARSKPGSVAHHRGLALLARVKFGVGVSEPEETEIPEDAIEVWKDRVTGAVLGYRAADGSTVKL